MELPHLGVYIPQFIDYGLTARVTGLRLQEEVTFLLQGADRSPALHDSPPRLPEQVAECSAGHWRLCSGPRLQEEVALPLQGADRSPALHLDHEPLQGADRSPALHLDHEPLQGADRSPALHLDHEPLQGADRSPALHLDHEPLQGADRSPALHLDHEHLHDSTPRLHDQRQEPIDGGVSHYKQDAELPPRLRLRHPAHRHAGGRVWGLGSSPGITQSGEPVPSPLAGI